MSSIAATSSSSIAQTNAAYLAQVQARRAGLPYANASGAAASSKTAVQNATKSFASEMTAVQSEPLPAPTPLKGLTTQTAQEIAEAEDVADETADHKISRSARMESAEKATEVESDDDFGFDDFVDFINPLHHIPIIGTIYRELTGDEIKPEVQIAGSVVFGLVTGSVLLGAASGIASAIYEENTGEEPTVQIARALFGDEDTVQVAEGEDVSEGVVQLAAVAPLAAPQEPVQEALIADATASAVSPALPPMVQSSAPTVRETAPLYTARDSGLAGAFAQAGAGRVGNVIYTSPQLRVAAKVAPTQTEQTQTALQSLQETNVATAQMQSVATTDEPSLGALIHEQARAQLAGQSLPPELVQDMMMKAYAKYSAVQNAGGDTGVVTAVQ